LEDLIDMGHSPANYGRRGTPGILALEEALCALDGAAGCRLTPSGLNACGLALQSVTRSGGHVLMIDTVYWPTRRFCDTVLKRAGIEVTYYDPMIGADIATLFRDNTQAVYVETPGSNTFEIPDLPAISRAAHDRDLPVLIDNTWATPYFYNPLDHGADIHVQAATKYLAGHADLFMGVVSANARWLPHVERAHRQMGLTVAPDDAYLVQRGLRTLGVRLDRHQETALKLAHWLKDQPEVARVLHPAFPGHEGHDIWARDFCGASGLFSVVLREATLNKLSAMLDEMTFFAMGWSWGGYESLMVPVELSNARTATEWTAPGPVLRIHAGLEDAYDLLADLEAGLERFRAAA
ncbi:MAG: cystathionine beta-lyase, partial [Alphaproteobacteria bacterium]